MSSYGHETIAQADQLPVLLRRNTPVTKHCSSLLLHSIHSSQTPSPKVGLQCLIFYLNTIKARVYNV